MSDNIPQRPREDSELTRYLKAYVLNKDSSRQLQAERVKKNLEVQVSMGELENLLRSMDQSDARVQRSMAKLQELKTAIVMALDDGKS